MQLLIKRTQRKGGMLGGKTIFALSIRAQYTEEERANINNYNLGGEVIYDSKASQRLLEKGATSRSNLVGFGYIALSKLALRITIASLQQGHTIEAKDLAELSESEAAIIDACKGLKSYLEAAASFDGGEIVVNLDELVA
jgi:hypothetical protein